MCHLGLVISVVIYISLVYEMYGAGGGQATTLQHTDWKAWNRSRHFRQVMEGSEPSCLTQYPLYLDILHALTTQPSHRNRDGEWSNYNL
jgi:hypothetical protein